MFFLKQRMGAWLIVRCNSSPWQPDCIVFQPSLDETSLDEFTVYQTTNETRIISTHRISLTRSLLHRLLLARWPSGCCTEEPHRRTSVTVHRRMDRHVAEVHRFNRSFGMFWRCTLHQHRSLTPQLQHRHRTGLHCDSFISLTGFFSCFLLG